MTANIFSVDLSSHVHECGGVFALSSETRDVRLGRKAFPIEQQVFVCSGCGEVRQTLTQIGTARRSAAKLARDAQTLLAPHEIRSIRESRLHVSQATLENALGLGAKTVVRWETGKVLQPKATDNLLRILDRDPSLLLFLSERNGVTLPAAVAEQLVASSQSITIPRRFLEEIQSAAASQGVGARDYALWVLAEHLSQTRDQIVATTPQPDVGWRAPVQSRRKIWQTGEFEVVRLPLRAEDDLIDRIVSAAGGQEGRYGQLT